MADTTSTPSAANRGMLPAGTFLRGWGTVVQASYTAYELLPVDPESDPFWVSFDRIHGRPEPVMPLVTLG